MTFNTSVRYHDGQLFVDDVAAADMAQAVGTPVYVYSLKHVLAQYHALREAFAPLGAHIHYSAKANANLALLRALIGAGAGIDAVSGGEIYKALQAGADPRHVVFAGVGKTQAELRYALAQGVGWFNVENAAELDHIERIAAELGVRARAALRFNPDITANTHPNIATGHGGAKFGMPADAVRALLQARHRYAHVMLAGVHVHIGSQLGDTHATQAAVERALELIAPFEDVRTLNIGGGFPARYHAAQTELPSFQAFADALTPLLRGYEVLIEPGRSLVAEAGVLLTQVLYRKAQGGQHIVIVDASMTELLRPALYGARHEIVPVRASTAPVQLVQVVGPVCETTDTLGHDVPLSDDVREGDWLAVLTCGAYGMVMASNYNARPRPAEVVVSAAGDTWRVARPRETWEMLVAGEG